MRVQFTPGALFRISAGQEFAYALMLAESPYIAFYPAHTSFEADGEPTSQPLFVVAVTREAYSTGKWGKPVRILSPGKVIPIPRFFWQNVTSKGACRILDPAAHRTFTASPDECIGLEREAVWDDVHIESRIIDAYAGRPNIWAESLKVRL
jgi:hypothetical protein